MVESDIGMKFTTIGTSAYIYICFVLLSRLFEAMLF